MSATVERPEVAVVRHPIADRRNNVVGYELRFGGAVDLGDPSRRPSTTTVSGCFTAGVAEASTVDAVRWLASGVLVASILWQGYARSRSSA